MARFFFTIVYKYTDNAALCYLHVLVVGMIVQNISSTYLCVIVLLLVESEMVIIHLFTYFLFESRFTLDIFSNLQYLYFVWCFICIITKSHMQFLLKPERPRVNFITKGYKQLIADLLPA